MEENRFWLGVWTIVGTVISILIVSVSLVIGINNYQFIKAGYTNETLPGTDGAYWVKK